MRLIRHVTLYGVLLTVSVCARAAGEPALQQFWQTPAVIGAGKVHLLPQAAYQPQPQETYAIVFSITKAADRPTEVNPSLQRVARAVNLYTSAGVPLSHLKFVTVIYDQAGDAALDDRHYHQKYGVDNPNLDLIRTLRNAGIDVAVSGETIADHQQQNQWIAPQVTLALSGLVTIANLQHEGYVLMPL